MDRSWEERPWLNRGTTRYYYETLVHGHVKSYVIQSAYTLVSYKVLMIYYPIGVVVIVQQTTIIIITLITKLSGELQTLCN